MKTFLVIAAMAVLTAVPAVAIVANKQKTAAVPPRPAPAQLAQEQAAPVAPKAERDGTVRQAGPLTATFVDGSADVKGKSFVLNPTTPVAPEIAAWEGPVLTAGGIMNLRFVQYPGVISLCMKSSGQVTATGEFTKSVIAKDGGGYFFPGPIIINMISFGYFGWGQIVLS